MYRQTRRRLFELHLEPWLRSLYALDVERYAQTVYAFCAASAGHDAVESMPVQTPGSILQVMTPLVYAGITSGCTIDLLATWLDQSHDAEGDVSIPAMSAGEPD